VAVQGFYWATVQLQHSRSRTVAVEDAAAGHSRCAQAIALHAGVVRSVVDVTASTAGLAVDVGVGGCILVAVELPRKDVVADLLCSDWVAALAVGVAARLFLPAHGVGQLVGAIAAWDRSTTIVALERHGKMLWGGGGSGGSCGCVRVYWSCLIHL